MTKKLNSFKCEICSKEFKKKVELSYHMRIHTGERPYICTFENCNKKFASNSVYRRHLRIHTGERPYICTFENCNKKFASNSGYIRHIRTHTGEKPYICQICGWRFIQSNQLKKHLQRIHRNESETLTIADAVDISKQPSL